MSARHPIYSLMATFNTPEELLVAARAAYAEGYRRMEAYTPFPIHGLAEAVGHRRNWMPFIVLMGGLAGGLGGYFMQYYSAVWDYPFNIGGRPLHSWPSFLPITFELTVLCAAFAAVLGMLALNGLPRPHHPVFNAPGFELASRNHFFLSIQAEDPRFDPEETKRFLESFRPESLSVVGY